MEFNDVENFQEIRIQVGQEFYISFEFRLSAAGIKCLRWSLLRRSRVGVKASAKCEFTFSNPHHICGYLWVFSYQFRAADNCRQ